MSKKQGLKGWKAFFVVLASGTIAGLVVVFIAVGIIKSLIFSVSSSFEESAASALPNGRETGKPFSSLKEGKLNICSTTIDTLSTVWVERIDSGENYADEIRGDGDPLEGARVVSDQCDWKLSPEYSSLSRWDLHVDYEAIVDPPQGKDSLEIASLIFEERKEEIVKTFSDVKAQGEDVLGDSSYFFFGSCDGGNICYTFLGRTRGSVYEISMKSSPNEEIPQEAFRYEMKKMVSAINLDLGLWIPE